MCDTPKGQLTFINKSIHLTQRLEKGNWTGCLLSKDQVGQTFLQSMASQPWKSCLLSFNFCKTSNVEKKNDSVSKEKASTVAPWVVSCTSSSIYHLIYNLNGFSLRCYEQWMLQYKRCMLKAFYLLGLTS